MLVLPHKLQFKLVPRGDVAPMTGAISTTQEHGLIFAFSYLKCFIIPSVPIHWVVGMLEQIRTLFFYQPVGLFVHEITPLCQLHYMACLHLVCTKKASALR